MNYAQIIKCDAVNGEGLRTSLFVSGCTHHCKGCFNEVAWSFTYGQPFTEKTLAELLELLAPGHIAGLTILGGEPMDPRNIGTVLDIVKEVKAKYPEKNIWIYTGYLYEDLIKRDGVIGKATRELLIDYVDVLVDGPYIEALRDPALAFRGSANQRILRKEPGNDKGNI